MNANTLVISFLFATFLLGYSLMFPMCLSDIFLLLLAILQKTCALHLKVFKAVFTVQMNFESTKCNSILYTQSQKVVKCLSCVNSLCNMTRSFSSEIQGTREVGANRGDRRRKIGEKCGAEYGGNISEKSGGHTSKYLCGK